MSYLAPAAEYTRFLVGLIAVLDPFMAIPVFVSMYAGRPPAEQNRFAALVALIVLAVLVVAALAGDVLLRLLGTSVASFRIAGGLVLLLMALAMLQTRVEAITPEQPGSGRSDFASAVPLAIPLLAGPGAISMVMLQTQQGAWLHRSVVLATSALACLALWLMLRFAARLGKAFGDTGLNIANRIVGLLLAAIAIELMTAGLHERFPGLGGGG